MYNNQNLPTNIAYTQLCSGHNWVMKFCKESNGLNFAFCVDCNDPCSQTSNCESNSLSNGLNSINSNKLSPCSPSGCSNISSIGISIIRILDFSFANYYIAPDLSDIFVSSTENSVTIKSTLSFDGIVFCGAFDSYNALDASNIYSSIESQNYLSPSEHNISVVNILSLFPSRFYKVYCMTKSKTGVYMAINKVLGTLTTVKTKCCQIVTASLMSNKAVVNKIYSQYLSISYTSIPMKNISILINVQLVSSPSNSPFDTLFYPKSFSPIRYNDEKPILLTSQLFAKQSGVYLVSISIISNNTVDYQIQYNNVNNKNFILNVYKATQIPLYPTLISAQYSNDGSYIQITFDINTNRGNIYSSFFCDDLFKFTCDVTSTCQWMSNNVVYAFISGFNCVQPGNLISLANHSHIKSAEFNNSLNIEWSIIQIII